MRCATVGRPLLITLNPTHFPAAMEFDARSLLAAPLMAFNEVIGAVTFLHDSDDEFFNEDLAAKATILAGQLGTLLEASRLAEASREEHRRAEILADVAQRSSFNARCNRCDRGIGRPAALAFTYSAGLRACCAAKARSN